MSSQLMQLASFQVNVQHVKAVGQASIAGVKLKESRQNFQSSVWDMKAAERGMHATSEALNVTKNAFHKALKAYEATQLFNTIMDFCLAILSFGLMFVDPA